MTTQKKQVPIEIRVRTVVEVFEDWDDHMVTFFYNESSHCIQTELAELASRDPEGVCTICQDTEVLALNPEEHAGLMEKYAAHPLKAPRGKVVVTATSDEAPIACPVCGAEHDHGPADHAAYQVERAVQETDSAAVYVILINEDGFAECGVFTDGTEKLDKLVAVMRKELTTMEAELRRRQQESS